MRLARRADARRAAFSLRDYPGLCRSLPEAIEEIVGIDRDVQAALLAEAVFPPRLPFDEGGWESRAPWIGLLYLLVSAKRPQQVIETGVQWGYSTATILAALPPAGYLDSIDLPNLDGRSRANHAAAVPASLRNQWRLHVGDTRVLLTRIAAQRRPVDLFVHDADHTYVGLMNELCAAWPALSPDGLIAVDGVWTTALIDFATEVRAPAPILIERASESDALGVLRRRD